MGSMSIWHWLIVLLVIVLLFGAKKIPELAKGLGSGIRTFKKELDGEKKEGEDAKPATNNATNAAKVETPQQSTPQQVEVIEAQVIESTPQNSNSTKEQKS